MSKNLSKVACILAAGTGSRLKSLTQGDTKCMVKVDGERLIDYLLNALRSIAYDAIVIVVGHRKESLMAHVHKTHADLKVRWIINDQYSTTNNIYSLYLASDDLATFDETHLFESDVYVRKNALIEYLEDPLAGDSVLVSPYEYWMDGTCVTMTDRGKVEAFISKRDVHRYAEDELFKTVNCYRFSAEFFCSTYRPFLRSYIEARGKNAYYEEVLKVTMPVNEGRLGAWVISPSQWMEIDDAEDLRRAQITAQQSSTVAARDLAAQYGGYWKNRGLTDLTLLENPFFPTPEFISEVRSQLQAAIKMYPSCQAVISSVASKFNDAEPEMIAVGNGASELIRMIGEVVDGGFAIIEPSFLEYGRVLGNRLLKIHREFPLVPYADSLAEASQTSDAHLILINPNNPTGECVSREEVLKAAGKLLSSGKYLLLDESFIDFSGEASCIDRAVLGAYPNIVVIKSLGKSFGAGGVRLGIACSADKELIARLRSTLPIWNISSLAEVFLDILPKYKTQYTAALGRLKQERGRYFAALNEREVLAYPSAGNFFLIAVPAVESGNIAGAFLENGFLVREVTRDGLSGAHIRLSIRDSATNDTVSNLCGKLLRKAPVAGR